MDAKSIYMATSHMRSKVDWEQPGGNEWSSVGEGADFKQQEVQEFIDFYFQEEELYFVIDRHNSYALPKGKAAIEVGSHLSTQDIVLTNSAFNRMIEFNYIGVAKHGTTSS